MFFAFQIKMSCCVYLLVIAALVTVASSEETDQKRNLIAKNISIGKLKIKRDAAAKPKALRDTESIYDIYPKLRIKRDAGNVVIDAPGHRRSLRPASQR